MDKTYQLQKLNGGMHFITLDINTASKVTKLGNKRLICTLNETESFHCAIVKRKDGTYLVHIGLKICNKLKLKLGASVTARFEIDTTAYQFEMPEELAEVLRTDPEANQIFHQLTAGNQRGLIYLVTQVKSTDKRIERALTIATGLRNGVNSPRKILK